MPSLCSSLPQGVHLSASGVVLSTSTAIEVPVSQVIASSLGSQFTVLIGVRSYRANNAFLFSIRNKNRLQFGVQLLPRKIMVHTGGKQSVYFDYTIHDEQWHSFAIGVTEKTVSLFAQCGRKHFIRETLSKVKQFDSQSLLTLGRMNSHSVNFEGVICQLDIIPSAQASVNYCKYVKQQCRQADTYRSQPTPPETSLGGLLNNLSKQLSEETLLDYRTLKTSKIASKNYVKDSAPVDVPPESAEIRHVTTALCLRNVTALEIMPGQNDQQIVNMSKNYQEDVSKRKSGPQTQTELLLNVTDNATENTSRKNYPPLLFSIKQIKNTNMVKNTSKEHSREPVEIHQILNTTLYRASDSLPLDNRLGPWGEDAFQVDETYNAEGSYELDIDGYDYDYEELERMFEMENLRGPKGDPGHPVSYLLLFLIYTVGVHKLHYSVFPRICW